ncbi:MAG: hypothetical protein HY042_03140, partial [Spirochaetia bacterium]|nr:hypothetical protein [Spirochaetia bacterium]
MSDALSGSFADNLSLPVHRWFRYSAGFSGDWARSVIADHLEEHSRVRVLDPFCGSGTVMIAADSLDAPSVGLDAHPFVSKIANVKSRWAQSAGLTEAASALLSAAKRKKPRKIRPPDLLVRCYDPQALERLLALRASLEDTLNSHDSVVRDLLWLAITSILRKSARVGTAQWQYLLPKKTKAAAGDPFDLFARQIDIMRDDIDAMTAAGAKARSAVLEGGDARSCPSVKTASVSLVLTSPPYPNNYDYADAVRLEMTFWGEVETWGDLHQSVRKRLMV